MLMTKRPQGQAIAMRVHEVKEKTVVVDFNNPLAGKTLNFDLKVTDIRAAIGPALRGIYQLSMVQRRPASAIRLRGL
jgi:FKBP-type peptidyl-prolyl cis-trans isomerase 2